jgi:hypothetical protein
MNHEAQNQQNQDSNQQFLNSLLSSSQLPMDLREEERISKSHKRVLPEVDLSGWQITCTEFPSHDKKQSTMLVRQHVITVHTFATIVNSLGICQEVSETSAGQD